MKEKLKKRTPADCKRCEHREFKGHRPYCMFWDNLLIKIKWCNK